MAWKIAVVVWSALSFAAVTAGKLVPFKYDPLPLGQIKARGWLLDQLRLSADGLAGSEGTFYRFAMNTTWTGGVWEYSTLHESSPYWFNYIVPLAFGLDDDRLKAQAKAYLDYVLDHQAEDGWLGPETTHQSRGVWARSLLLFGLTQYAEADPTETDRIVNAMLKFTSLVNTMLKDNFTGLIQHGDDNFDTGSFGLARTQELPLSFQWLYDNHPNGQEDMLLETMELMYEGGRVGGYDWSTFFVESVFPKVEVEQLHGDILRFVHGVNIAEAFRYLGILYRMNGNESLVQQSFDAVNLTFTYHGSSSGTILGDELLAGLSPRRGSELCTVAETTFSMHWLYRMFGNNYYADRAELAMFNAFPAALSADHWSHQYMAQPNQPWAMNMTETPFYDVNSYGNTFSLEPNYPCCTVNHGQTYPKFLAATYVRKGSNGLVHALLSPASVTTTLGNGTNKVTVTSDTLYPFGETINYQIAAEKPFDFYIRVPSWAVSYESSISTGSTASASRPSPDNDSLQHVSVPAGNSTVSVTFGMGSAPVIEERNATSGSFALHRGPLVYALDVKFSTTEWSPLQYNTEEPLPSYDILPETRDHEYLPTKEWRIAIDPKSVTVQDSSKSVEELPNPIFASGAPPVKLVAAGCAVAWGNDTGTAAVPPAGPTCLPGYGIAATLVPYGSAKLRIAEFPRVEIG